MTERAAVNAMIFGVVCALTEQTCIYGRVEKQMGIKIGLEFSFFK